MTRSESSSHKIWEARILQNILEREYCNRNATLKLDIIAGFGLYSYTVRKSPRGSKVSNHLFFQKLGTIKLSSLSGIKDYRVGL